MNHVRLSSCAAAVAAILGVCVCPAFSADGWSHDVEAALAKAKKQNKPVVLHFYADWCGPCQTMERTVLNTGSVTALLGKDVIGVKVNVDRRGDLRSKHGIAGFPSDVVLSPEGKELSRSTGLKSVGGYASMLRTAAAPYRETEHKVIVKKDAKPGKKSKQATSELGLDGYSPVTLKNKEEWVKGEAGYEAEYRGISYRMANEEELEKFKAAPAYYAPKHLGCDPLVLHKTGRAVPGKIEFGAFYESNLYLLSSQENQKQFLANPGQYANGAFGLDVEDIEQVAQSERSQDASTQTR